MTSLPEWTYHDINLGILLLTGGAYSLAVSVEFTNLITDAVGVIAIITGIIHFYEWLVKKMRSRHSATASSVLREYQGIPGSKVRRGSDCYYTCTKCVFNDGPMPVRE